MMGVNHDFLAGNFVYAPLDDCPTIYRKHQDYSLSKFKKDSKNERILNNYKDALEELQELREYKRLTILRSKKYEENIYAYKSQIKNLKKHMYSGNGVNIKLINVFITLICDIIEHLCIDPYRSVFSSLPFIHTILCSSPIRDKKIYNCSKLVHFTLTKNVSCNTEKKNMSLNRSSGNAECMNNANIDPQENKNLCKLVSDLEWLGCETNDKKWLTLQDRWNMCSIDLKWLCVSTNNRTWILYRHIWNECPDDLKFITVLTNEKKWLNLYKLWKTIPLNAKLKAIASNKPEICTLSISEILTKEESIHEINVLSLHKDIFNIVEQNSLRYKLAALSQTTKKPENTHFSNTQNTSNSSDNDNIDDVTEDSDYMESFAKIRELENQLSIKNNLGYTNKKSVDIEVTEKENIKVKTPSIVKSFEKTSIKKEMNGKETSFKNMKHLIKKSVVSDESKTKDFSKKTISPIIKKEESSKAFSIKMIPSIVTKTDSTKDSKISFPIPSSNEGSSLQKKNGIEKKEIIKMTVRKTFGVKKEIELKKHSVPLIKKDLLISKEKTEIKFKENTTILTNSEKTTKEEEPSAKENKTSTMKTKIPTIKTKIPPMKNNKMLLIKNGISLKEEEANKPIQESVSLREEIEKPQVEPNHQLNEEERERLGVGQRILETITNIILPKGNSEEFKKETNKSTLSDIKKSATTEGKAKMDQDSMNKLLLLKKKMGVKKVAPSVAPPSLPIKTESLKMLPPFPLPSKIPKKEGVYAKSVSHVMNLKHSKETKEEHDQEKENSIPLKQKEESIECRENAENSNLNIEIQRAKQSEEKKSFTESLLDNAISSKCENDSKKVDISSDIKMENKYSGEIIHRQFQISEKRPKSVMSHKYIDLKKNFNEGINNNLIPKTSLSLKSKPVFDKTSNQLLSAIKKPPPILKKVLETDLSNLDPTNKKPTADVIAKRTNVSLYVDVKRKNSLSSLLTQKKKALPPKFPKSKL